MVKWHLARRISVLDAFANTLGIFGAQSWLVFFIEDAAVMDFGPSLGGARRLK